MLDPKNVKNGEEQSEAFTRGSKRYCQYDYRDLDGELFSCVRENLHECRKIVMLKIAAKYGNSKEVR